MKSSTGSGAIAAAFGLVAVLVGMTLFGGAYKVRLIRSEPTKPPKVPLASAMLSAISTQERAVAEKVTRATADLATLLAATGGAAPGADDKALERLGALGEKVGAAVDADDGVYGALREMESQLSTVDAVLRFPPPPVPGETLAVPTGDERRSIGTALASLREKFHAAGSALRQSVRAAIAEGRQVQSAINAGGLRAVDARRRFRKAEAAVGGIVEKLAGLDDRHPGWFNGARWNMLAAFLLLSGAVLYYIRRGERGEKLTIRRISGLNALDEAVGRATEMGKPVLYVTGIMDIDDIQTLSGLNILGHVARKTAEYEADLNVPSLWPLTLSAAQEIVRESYLRAGKPDDYDADSVYYLSSDQFAFAAGASGIMQRERPATIFYMGSFYAESLLMAEVGNLVGAIQIAGTAQQTQLPFFVAACDYTLIGEELFAASAYLSEEPMLLGSLKGQDAGKVVMMAAIVAGTLVELAIAYDWLPVAWSTIELWVAK
jgi:hypothetical protein